MTAASGLMGAAIGVMCIPGAPRDRIVAAIRSRGAHGILLDEAGHVTGTSRELRAAAVVVDLSHPECLSMIDVAVASRVPVVASADAVPNASTRARLEALGIELVLAPDADTLGRALLRAIARTHDRRNVT
jgi:hypothetical protein